MIRHRLATATLVALTLAATATGCGSKDEPKAAAQPAEDATNTVELAVTTPESDVVTTDGRLTIKGTATPSAHVQVEGGTEPAAVAAAADGSWSRTVRLAMGTNEITVSAERDGFESSPTHELTARRKRTAAQSAAFQAAQAEKRRAQLERERVAEARAKAAKQAKFDAAVARAAAGDAGKMSSAVAREVARQCGAGIINDFDVCFEAGYKTGSDVAEKYAE